MRNILNIIKKELDKIFKSPRQIFGTFLLPGLMIFIIYSVMGMASKAQIQENEQHEYVVMTSSESVNLNNILENLYIDETTKYKVVINKYDTTLSNTEIKNEIEKESQFKNTIQNELKDGNYDLFIFIDDDFDDVISKNKVGQTDIIILTHTQNTFSVNLGNIISSYLYVYENSINPANSYILNTKTQDIATDSQKGSTILSMLAPMLIITFIFAGALSIGTDSIAGEKERGTIATMMMAPISRNDIIMGKIISAIIITVIASICSFIGLMASISNLTSSIDSGDSGILFTFTFSSVVFVLILILFTSLIAVSLFLIASTYAKTTKEATMFSMPIYIISIICGTMAGFSSGLPSNIVSYFVPIYNLAIGLKAVFMNNLNGLNFFIIFATNFIFFILILYAVRKMFESEKIMFSR